MNRLTRWLLLAGARMLPAALLVGAVKASLPFLLIIAVWLVPLRPGADGTDPQRSDWRKGIVGIRYARTGLLQRNLTSRQREALMRKAREVFGES